MKSELIELKVKRKQLASEAKDIRKEERKALSYGRALLSDFRATGSTTNDPNKWPEDCRHTYRTFRRLNTHRKGTVRSAARHAHLAAGFINGTAYSAMERSRYTEPSRYGIADNVRRFHPDPAVRRLSREQIIGLLNEWIDGKPVSLAAE